MSESYPLFVVRALSELKKALPVMGGVMKIVTNGYSAFFITNDGDVYSCGDNQYGQLGRVVASGSYGRVNLGKIPGLENVVDAVISPSYGSAYFLTAEGDVYNCGYNNYGQLGRVTSASTGSETVSNLGQVTGIGVAVAKITVNGSGYINAHFLTAAGDVWNCGYNGNGELGRSASNGSYSTSNLARLTTISNVADVQCGQAFTCFLTASGDVWNCGENSFGQLGVAKSSGAASTVNLTQIAALANVAKMFVAFQHAYFVKTTGECLNCGYNNYGTLGRAVANGSTSTVNLGALSVSAMGTIKKIVTNRLFTSFLSVDGRVFNCGYNNTGQLGRVVGNGSDTVANLGELTGMPGIVDLATGEYTSYFITTGGEAWSCGRSQYGALGREGKTVYSGTTGYDEPNLGRIDNLPPVSAAIIGGTQNNVQFLTTDGRVFNCGNNQYGSLGRIAPETGVAQTNLGEVTFASAANIADVQVGYDAIYFLLNNGTVYSAGGNSYGQLGRVVASAAMGSSNLGQISGLSNIAKIIPGYHCCFFINASGVLYACGRNDNKNLGFSTATGSATTSNLGQVATSIADVAPYYYSHTLFLTTSGSASSAGKNDNGQLGRSVADQAAIGAISGLSGIVAIKAGNACSYFLNSAGQVYNCGSNSQGRLGRVASTGSATSVNLGAIPELTGVVKVASVGSSGNCLMLKSDGSVLGAGQNANGELVNTPNNGSASVANLTILDGLPSISKIFDFPYREIQASIFLAENGEVWNAGQNLYGQLGRSVKSGDAAAHNLGKIPGLSGVVDVMIGMYRVHFRKADGSVLNCGRTMFGGTGRGVAAGADLISNLGLVPLENVEYVRDWSEITVFKTSDKILTCGYDPYAKSCRDDDLVNIYGTNLDMITEVPDAA